MHSGIKSGRGSCCRLQVGSVHLPASHFGQTATFAGSCTRLQTPLSLSLHLPVLPVNQTQAQRVTAGQVQRVTAGLFCVNTFSWRHNWTHLRI